MSAVWKQLALSDDLPITYSGAKEGLVPQNPDNTARDLYLDNTGNWTRPVVSNLHGDATNFQRAVDESPEYTDAEIGRHLSFVKGLSIASISADGTNVTIVTNREHGILQSDISGGATITITGCSNSAYNGTKTPNGIPTVKSITFAETDETAVTILGYMTTSGVANTKEDYMLRWASDVGLAEHSVAFSKLPEISPARVIGRNPSSSSGDAEEIVIELTPTSASTNLITSGGVYAYVNGNTFKETIDKLGTIDTGTWNGSAIADGYISSASTWNGKQDALTFGIAQNNTVKVSSAVVDDSSGVIFPKFTATGLTARSSADFKSDLSLAKADVGLSNVTNDAQLPLSGGTMTGDITLPSDGKTVFGDAGEYIKGDGSKLYISSTNWINFADSRIEAINRIVWPSGTMDNFLDEDDMASNDDTSAPSQQSVKAYVDNTIRDIKSSGFNYSYTAGTKVYIPLGSVTTENSSTSGGNDYRHFVVPFDGYLDQVVFRSEEACGSTIVGFHKSSTGVEVPSSTASATVTVDMTTDDTAYKFDFTSNNTFSAGDIIAISFDPTNDANDTNATVVLVYDGSQGV